MALAEAVACETSKGIRMQIALIDTFIVPEESSAPLLEASRTIQSILKTLPGFVEDSSTEAQSGWAYNIVTTAVWESEEAVQRREDSDGSQVPGDWPQSD